MADQDDRDRTLLADAVAKYDAAGGPKVTDADTDAFAAFVFEVGQNLFLTALTMAGLHGHPVAQAPALTAAALEAAWALAAAYAEDGQVLGERHGELVGLDQRLASAQAAIRQMYYPVWRRMIAAQGGPKVT